MRKEYEPREAGAGEDASGVPLVPFRERPLVRATTAIDVFFMVLWAFVLGWPLWNRVVNRGLLRGEQESQAPNFGLLPCGVNLRHVRGITRASSLHLRGITLDFG